MFGDTIREFSESLASLRDFVDLVAPFLTQKHAEKLKKDAFHLAPLVLLLRDLHPLKLSLDEASVGKITELLANRAIEVDVEEGEAGERTIHIKASPGYIEAFEQATKDLQRRQYQQELLYKSSLTNLIGSVEWFLARILHQYFEKFPEAVEERGKVFSLQDLKSIGSIEDAKAYVIDSCVEQILRGSFNDWLAFLKQRIRLSMGYIEEHRPKLAEVCERRNLLLHHGGIVNSIYLAKVPAELRQGLSIGDQVHVTRPYLEDAISRFERCLILIAAELWKKIDPKDEERAEVLIDIAYEHLVAERWDVAESLSYFTMCDRQLPEKSHLIGTINYWQSVKWQDRFEEARDEIEATDFSAKDEVFRLAQLVLLDDEEGFFQLLPHALNSGSLPKRALAEWPLFREMRKSPKYIEEYQAELGDLADDIPVSIRAAPNT